MKCPHGKGHDKGTTGSTGKDTDGRYSSQLLGPDDDPSHMGNPESVGSRTAVHVQTAVQLVNAGGTPRIPFVVTELEEILLQIASQGYQTAASQLIKVLPDRTFDMEIFKRIIRNLKDCEQFSCKRTKENMKDYGFQRVLVRGRGERNEGHGTLHVKKICQVLQRQIELCGYSFIFG